MSQPVQVVDWFVQLMGINRAAVDSGHYEVAYHALMAALHAAQDAGDRDRLQEVKKEATVQQARIDARAPGHRLSSGEAGRHGVIGIFRMAARQAAARATILRHDARAREG